MRNQAIQAYSLMVKATATITTKPSDNKKISKMFEHQYSTKMSC